MFLLRQTSRNQMNLCSQESKFHVNIKKLFNINFAHMDTVNNFFKKLNPEFLEEIKHKILQIILSRKVLNKFRLFDKYHLISIDGVTLFSSEKEPYKGCPYRDYENGNRVYLTHVLEAKLVCKNGFCLSIATEWLKNENEFKKQDCEKKAFTRLCKMLRTEYPKLPICIVTDGLFVGKPNILLCKELDFRYIFTLQDGSIPDMHRDFNFRKQAEKSKHTKIKHFATDNEIYYLEYFYSNDIHYRKNDIDMLQVIELVMNKKTQKITEKKFLYVTDIEVNYQNVDEVIRAGRMRWKIENEGFNTQKNSGYNVCHKFNRNNLNAMQNFYQCLQMAHIIEQLLVKSKLGMNLIAKKTLKWVWKQISCFLVLCLIDEIVLNNLLTVKKQFIY